MTKIGEDHSPHEPTKQQVHQELSQSSTKFLNALETYHLSGDAADKAHLKSLMDQQLKLIRASVNELKRSGIDKQEVKVENDYKAYMINPSSENFAALEHDVSTLQDYNN